MEPSTQVLFAILIILLSWPLLRAVVQRRNADIFAPSILFSVCLMYGYVYPLPRFLEGTDTFSMFLGGEFNHFANSLRFSVLLVILGVVGLYLGYRMGKNQGPVNGSQDTYVQVKFGQGLWDPRKLRSVGWIYSLIGLAMFSVGTALLGGPSMLIHGLGDRLRLFEGLYLFILPVNLLLVVTLVWWTYLLSTGRKVGVLFFSYAVFSFLLNGLQGNKSTLLVFIVSFAVLYHYLRRRLSLKYVAIGAAASVLLLTFYALFAREYLVAGAFETIDVQDVPTSVILGAVDRALEAEAFQLQMLTFLVDRMPEGLDFQYGKTLLPLLTTPIPRKLWPGKPVTVPGTIAMAYWPDDWLDSGTTHPPGLLGECYINLSGPGCFLGMLGFGYLYGRFRRNVLRTPTHPLALARYSILLALIPHYFRGEFVSATVMYATFAIPIWCFQLLLVSPGTAPGAGLVAQTLSQEG